MLTPNQDHPIDIAPERGTVTAIFEGHALAQSDDVLIVREAGYEPVRYFPRDDVEMLFLRRTDKTSHCPYKGHASYYRILRDGQIVDDAAWSYEDPYPAMGQLAGRIAFYPEHVQIQADSKSVAQTQADDRDTAGASDADPRVDEVVQHTDSGSGDSQATHWRVNVDQPDDVRDEAGADKAGQAPAKPYEGTGAI